uniref:Tabinhibitin 8 n=1 Tax=Tabanus yao TaxID=485572 RepID=INH8_TABYA|nr:RecName: Full=Tabinhibitin 8; Flags: Precursor [Tabanus yao]ACT33295.1 putative tabinhibitin 8 [Tabanus yao]
MTSILVSRFKISALTLQYATSDSVNFCRIPCRGCDEKFLQCWLVASFHCGKGGPQFQKAKRVFLVRYTGGGIIVLRDSWGYRPFPMKGNVGARCVPEGLKSSPHTRGFRCLAASLECYSAKSFLGPLLCSPQKRGPMQKHNIRGDTLGKSPPCGPKGNFKGLPLVIFDGVPGVGGGLWPGKLGGKTPLFFSSNCFSGKESNPPVYKTGNLCGEKSPKKEETFKNFFFFPDPFNPNEQNFSSFLN